MYEIYTIMSGDTWNSIADKYGTTVGILKQINGIIADNEVVAGRQIVVPYPLAILSQVSPSFTV